MKPVCRAVIDVGTNSVKLLVAEVAGNNVQPLLERSVQTRLGGGLEAAHRLRPSAIQRTAKVVAEFAAIAAQWQATSTRVIATSAAREASNKSDLIRTVSQIAGLPLEVISGEQEADWAFQGVTTDPQLACRPLLIMDAGGGSTQFVYGDGAQQPVCYSYRLGAVRLLEQLQPSDPPLAEELARCRADLNDFLDAQVAPVLDKVMSNQAAGTVQLIGAGGTSSVLASMHLGLTSFDRERIESVQLSCRQVRQHLERLWSLSLDERKRLAGLPPPRADVILTGVAIHEAVMVRFGFRELRVSTRGLRYAALMG
jgi:exopolyphosphatase/guanosine-5'-triphosphate,3'-diphosphate pyrophosphatase